MLYLTIGLFAVAAVVGLLILKNWLTASNTSRTVIYAHGIFAAAALTSFANGCRLHSDPPIRWGHEPCRSTKRPSRT